MFFSPPPVFPPLIKLALISDENNVLTCFNDNLINFHHRRKLHQVFRKGNFSARRELKAERLLKFREKSLKLYLKA